MGLDEKSFVGEPLVGPGGIRMYVNPGTGIVEGASITEAVRNMEQLLIDAGMPGAEYAMVPQADSGGRYGFLVLHASRAWDILMPGLPLDQVRFMGVEGQNPWDYPRLYVDGGSWLWKIAVGILREDALCRTSSP